MESHEVQASPQVYARIGGVLYLIMIVVGIFNEAFVKGRIVVSGDAMATAANLKSMESLWRFGIAGEMLMVICIVALSLILYVLLRPVSGYLIFRSAYFPRAIGILYQIAGVAYLANGFVLILAPGFAGQMFNVMVLPAFVGETSFCLCLLIKGVNVRKWNERIGCLTERHTQI